LDEHFDAEPQCNMVAALAIRNRLRLQWKPGQEKSRGRADGGPLIHFVGARKLNYQ